MRLLVCGGRDYADKERVFETLDRVHTKRQITLLIHGQATGADTLAKLWAKSRGVALVEFPANWTGEGDAAGPIRNQRMLDLVPPDGVVAFPGQAGTPDMCRRAEAAGVKVMRVDWS